MQWTSHLGSFQLTWSIALQVTIEKHCFIRSIQLTGILLLTKASSRQKTVLPINLSGQVNVTSSLGFCNPKTVTVHSMAESLFTTNYAVTGLALIQAPVTDQTRSFSVTFSSTESERSSFLTFIFCPCEKMNLLWVMNTCNKYILLFMSSLT